MSSTVAVMSSMVAMTVNGGRDVIDDGDNVVGGGRDVINVSR